MIRIHHRRGNAVQHRYVRNLIEHALIEAKLREILGEEGFDVHKPLLPGLRFRLEQDHDEQYSKGDIIAISLQARKGPCTHCPTEMPLPEAVQHG